MDAGPLDASQLDGYTIRELMALSGRLRRQLYARGARIRTRRSLTTDARFEHQPKVVPCLAPTISAASNTNAALASHVRGRGDGVPLHLSNRRYRFQNQPGSSNISSNIQCGTIWYKPGFLQELAVKISHEQGFVVREGRGGTAFDAFQDRRVQPLRHLSKCRKSSRY